RVVRYFRDHGYYPAAVELDGGNQLLTSAQEAARRADHYLGGLKSGRGLAPPVSERGVLPTKGAVGFAERVEVGPGRIVVDGWALDPLGNIPEFFMIRASGRAYAASDITRRPRPDVQRHFGLSHCDVGFRLEIRNLG